MQPAIFHPRAIAVIRLFPRTVRRALGEALLDLQQGANLGMPLSRPMPAVAPGVCELRVKDAAGIYRVFYLVKSQRGVVVFHASGKKTQKTPAHEIELGRKRLREVLYE